MFLHVFTVDIRKSLKINEICCWQSDFYFFVITGNRLPTRAVGWE
jgi:hypothetical protein